MQVIRDVISVSESTNWSQRSGPSAKYHALRCEINHLDPSSEEYNEIYKFIISNQDRYYYEL